MKKRCLKLFRIITINGFLFFSFFVFKVVKATDGDKIILPSKQRGYSQRLRAVIGEAGYSEVQLTLAQSIGNIIAYVLGLIGLIFFILVIYAGIMWMTAGGEKEKVEKAKQTIINSTIGLGVTLAAYIITRTVVKIFT